MNRASDYKLSLATCQPFSCSFLRKNNWICPVGLAYIQEKSDQIIRQITVYIICSVNAALGLGGPSEGGKSLGALTRFRVVYLYTISGQPFFEKGNISTAQFKRAQYIFQG